MQINTQESIACMNNLMKLKKRFVKFANGYVIDVNQVAKVIE